MILAAKRPLIMIGAGGNRPRSSTLLCELRAPHRHAVLQHPDGQGRRHRRHPTCTWARPPCRSGTTSTGRSTKADLIIAIGHDTVEKPPFIMGPAGRKVIHIGFTSANVEQVYFPHAEVVGDIGASLALLADRLGGKLRTPIRICSTCGRRSWPASTTAPTRIASRSTPQRIVHDVRKVMPDDGIVCLDNGMYKIWFARNYRTHVRQYASARQRARDHGRRTAVGHDGRDPASGAARPRGLRRRRLHDELAGTRDRRPAQAEPRRADPGRLRLWHDPLEAGGRRFPGLRA